MLDYKDFILEDTSKEYAKGDEVTIKCFYCGNLRKIKMRILLQRLSTNWLSERITCGCVECNKLKKGDINREKAKLGCSPHTGCKVSKEQLDKWRATMKELHPNWCQSHRKGKSYIEQYGEEKSTEIKDKNSQGVKKYIVENGHPFQGKKHKKSSKIKMSESRNAFLKGDKSKEKKYIDSETGELIDWFENNSRTKKNRWNNLSAEERELISLEATMRYLDRDGNYIMHSKTGYIHHWLLDKDQKFESSYEEAFFNKCNDEKLFWKKNNTIYIPYIHPIKKEKRFYVPDVLLFEDNNFDNITTIIEVKPNKFVENAKNYKSDYFEITKSKIEALKDYCNSNNYNCLIITENELGDYLEN